jgi:hypothetical protein
MSRKRKPVTRGLTSAATTIVPVAVQTLTVGQFGISDLGNGKVWLGSADGEGLETTAVKLEQALKKFFREEF